MGTYVYSLHGGARLAHLGTGAATACGYVFFSAYRVTDDAPADRPICRACVRVPGARAEVEETRRNVVEQRDALIVALLKDGAPDHAVARHLRIANRTISRYVNAAMRRAGARTRFQWGYNVGLADGAR